MRLKKTPVQKVQYLQNGVIFFSDLGRKFAIDVASAILCKFVEMVRLLVFNALFSSERALFSV